MSFLIKDTCYLESINCLVPEYKRGHIVNNINIYDDFKNKNIYIETPQLLITEIENNSNNHYGLKLALPKNKKGNYRNFIILLSQLEEKICSLIREDSQNLYTSFNTFLRGNSPDNFIYVKCKKKINLWDSNKNLISNTYPSTNLKDCLVKMILKPGYWLNNSHYGFIFYCDSILMCEEPNYRQNEFNFSIKNNYENTCSVCHNNLKDNNSRGITKLSCNHSFHMDCINKWFLQCNDNNLNQTCPICRAT